MLQALAESIAQAAKVKIQTEPRMRGRLFRHYSISCGGGGGAWGGGGGGI